MALVFTAISNSLAALLLLARWQADQRGLARVRDVLRLEHVLVIALISIGLYGFGMSLNDLIDRRRDRQLAPQRPLPSGRVGVITAHVICVLLALVALVGGILYSRWTGNPMSLLLVAWTGLLITFYDLAGKYLVGPGLLTLGLIRFFHAVVPAPDLPLLWHPLLLLNHVTILSLIAYHWEEKRPPLTPAHWWGVLSGLATVNVLSVALVWSRRTRVGLDPWTDALSIEPALLIPLACVLGFVALAWYVRRSVRNSREAGQTLMLYGLLWLIVYDVAFVAAFVGLVPALALLILLPLAYASVQLMRWWGRLITLSQRPGFKRADA
ncbi:MAG TPA: UbiA family prenyltransferase [Tepidisphaeraceae bacterium]|nr:UbiA family prenyltransferase [Tepidisphaeraceae bacterium]